MCFHIVDDQRLPELFREFNLSFHNEHLPEQGSALGAVDSAFPYCSHLRMGGGGFNEIPFSEVMSFSVSQG